MTFTRPSFGVHSKRWLLDHLFDEKLRTAAPHIDGRVLDVGCGSARYRRLLNGARYIGVDLKAPADVKGDALQLPFATASMDTILCFQMLDDQAEPLELLRELHRVLKASGTLLLSADLSWRVHDGPRDYYRFTCYGLAHLTSKAGFKIDSIQPLGGFWALVATRIAYRMSDRLGKYRLLRPLLWFAALPFLLWCGLILDGWDFRPEDTKGYFMRATRWPDHDGLPPQPLLARSLSI